MKRFLILSTLVHIIVSMLFVSCSSEDNEPINTEIPIEITLPNMDDVRVRSFGDASYIDNLKCYVYDTSKGINTTAVGEYDIQLQNNSGKKVAFYKFRLPKNKNYDFVFLATSGSHRYETDKLYYNSLTRKLNINYDYIGSHDETIDCFWGILSNVDSSNGPYKVTLKRPFAQLNIGSIGLSEYNESLTTPLNSTEVSVNNVYSTLDLMSGSVSNPVNLSWQTAEIPYGNTFPVNGYEYLFMNYLLVNERMNTTVTMTVAGNTHYFSDIPLQRNYQSNIYGNLLTTSIDFNVTINPSFN